MIWEFERRFAFSWSKVWPAQGFIDVGAAITNKTTLCAKTFTTASFFLRVMIVIACLIIHINCNFATWTIVENKVWRGGARGTGGGAHATGGGAHATGRGAHATGRGARGTGRGARGTGTFGSPSV